MEIFRLFGSIFIDSGGADDTLDHIDERGKSAGARLSDIAKLAGAAGLALGAMGVGVGVAAVSFTDDFRKSMNGLAAETGATTEEMKGFEESAKRMYNNGMGENFEDIAKSMALVKQTTGQTGAELEKLTNNALLLRDTYEYEVNESVRSSDKLMKQFGLSGEEAMGLIAEASQKGLNYADDLLPTIDEYSVYFAQAGFSASEMFGVFENAKNAGVFNLDYAADAVKEFGIKMTESGDATTQVLNQMGLDGAGLQAQFAKGGDGAREAFSKVAETLSQVDDKQQQIALGVSLFGTKFEDVGAAGVLAMTELNSSITGTNGALESINAVKYNTFGEAMSGIKRQLETGILLPLGEKILPKLNEFAGWISGHMPEIQAGINAAIEGAGKAFDGLSSAIGWVIDNGNILLPVVIGLTAAIAAQSVINTVTMAYKAWKAATTAQTTVQWLLNAAMNANPLGLVAIAIGAVAAGAYLLIKNWEPVSEFFVNLWASVTEITSAAWEGIKLFFTGLWDWMVSFLTEWGPAILLVIAPFLGIPLMIIQHWDTIKAFLLELWDGIKAAAITTWTAIKDSTEKIWNGLKAFLAGLWDGIKSSASAAWDGIKSAISTIISATVSWIKDTWNGVLNWFRELPGKLYNIGTDMFSRMRDAVSTTIVTVKTAIVTGMTSAMDYLKKLPAQMLQMGKDIIQGLIDGIKNMIGGVGNAISSIASKITGGIRDALDMHSPSRVMRSLGNDTGEGYVIGLEDKISAIQEQSDAMAAAALPSVENMDAGSYTASIAGAGGYGSAGSDHEKYIVVQVNVDGNNIATAIAKPMSAALGALTRSVGRSGGVATI